jgi:hypothetical protein
MEKPLTLLEKVFHKVLLNLNNLVATTNADSHHLQSSKTIFPWFTKCFKVI